MKKPADIIECPIPTHKNFVNLTGKIFSRLLVVRFFGKRPHIPKDKYYWLCKCSCGSETVVMRDRLNSGKTRSCGCLRVDLLKTHGLSQTPEYACWFSLVDRCNNPNSQAYKWYGSRGIKVCERWLTVENFIADMGCRPSPLHSIERINNDGGYEPSNCCWIPLAKQSKNRRGGRHLTFNGKTKSVTEWAEYLNVSFHAIFKRLQYGWSVERTLTEPVKKHVKRQHVIPSNGALSLGSI